jgi:gamma-glutamyl hercynylcysteine S-oxide hydrolase
MCRLIGWYADHPVTAAEALGDDVLERLMALSTIHSDGWGAAWFASEGGSVRTQRSQASAATDPDFTTFLHDVPLQCCLLHLRLASPGMGLGIEDNHPFVRDGFAFAHNGAIFPPSGIDALLYDDSDAPRGTTDSERYFLSLLHDLPLDPSAVEIAGAAGRVVRRMVDHELTALSLNSMLLSGGVLHVISNHRTGVEPQGVTLWPASVPEPPPYFALTYRRRDGVSLAVSSGLLPVEGDDVSPLPAGNILTLRPGEDPLEVTAIAEPLLATVNPAM